MAIKFEQLSNEKDATCAVCLDPSNCGLYSAKEILKRFPKEPKLAKKILQDMRYDITLTPEGFEVPCPTKHCAEFLKVYGL